MRFKASTCIIISQEAFRRGEVAWRADAAPSCFTRGPPLSLREPYSKCGSIRGQTASSCTEAASCAQTLPTFQNFRIGGRIPDILSKLQAGSMTFTLATSDMITAATAIIVPSLLWFVRTLFGLLNKLSIEIKGVSNDVAELVKSMHRLEVNTIREQAASEARSTKNLLFALEGKFPSTDPESVSNASESAENASDSP
ncbi:hypothetical protein Ndes2526A_g09571 [Nannochloris sp. 'desiccata']